MFSDQSLAKMVGLSNPLVTGVDPAKVTEKDGAIQPGSIDLSVGEIFRPGPRGFFKREHKPVSEIVLKQGETAVIRSNEELNMPSNVAAIAFPPARASTRGLLMTNAGHIDPGYQGYMHLTVINMGRKEYTIRTDDRLVSLLFFKLDKAPASDWIARRGGTKPTDSGLIDTALDRLSRDFLNVQARAKSEAASAVARMTLWQFVIPIVASILTSSVAVYLYSRQSDAAIARLEGRLSGIGANVNLDTIEQRLKKVEKKLPK